MEPIQVHISKEIKEAYLDTPFYFPKLDKVYIGTWLEKKPYGIGKILYLEPKPLDR